jgi:REP element-mobilizing transposase RayT
MSRQLRVLFPGALYHVTSRGNERRPIYRTNGDREHFLELLELAIERYRWICHGYCLMGNHHHLVVETPAANLPEGMRHLNGRYAQTFNRRHDRVGYLFQGRYHAVLVEKDAYLLELVRYVSLNRFAEAGASGPRTGDGAVTARSSGSSELLRGSAATGCSRSSRQVDRRLMRA